MIESAVQSFGRILGAERFLAAQLIVDAEAQARRSAPSRRRRSCYPRHFGLRPKATFFRRGPA